MIKKLQAWIAKIEKSDVVLDNDKIEESSK
jgi:hypothetical protein